MKYLLIILLLTGCKREIEILDTKDIHSPISIKVYPEKPDYPQVWVRKGKNVDVRIDFSGERDKPYLWLECEADTTKLFKIVHEDSLTWMMVNQLMIMQDSSLTCLKYKVWGTAKKIDFTPL